MPIHSATVSAATPVCHWILSERQLSKEGLQNVVEDKEEANSLSTRELRDLFKLREDTVSDTLEKIYQPRSDDDRLPMPVLADDDEAMCSGGSSDEEEGSSDGEEVDEDFDERDGDMAEGAGELQPETAAAKKKKKKKKKKKERAPFRPTRQEQVAFPPDADLNNWAHHLSYASVDDPVMREALGHGPLDGEAASAAAQRASDAVDAGVSPVSFVFACTVDETIVQPRIEEEEATQVRLLPSSTHWPRTGGAERCCLYLLH